MATVSVSGLTSGINYADMISRIIAVDSQPITLLQSRQADYNKRISVYGDLSSKLAALKTAADGMKTVTNFYARTASSSDETVFSATAASSAAEGNYSITVTDLAQAHRVASSTVAAETSTVSAASGNFSFHVGAAGATTTVAVDATTSLAQLRDGINAAKGDAQATIINDGTGYRLVLTSKTSGEDNPVVVTENVTTLGLPTGPVAGGTTLQAAQDAVFSIDTLPMTRSANTFSDGIQGVTVTVKKEGTSTLSVGNDASAIRKKIDDFVAAYNAVVSLVSKNSTYNATTQMGGAFTGESTARGVVSSLQGLIETRVDGLPDGMKSLSQIGVKTNRDGTLSVDGAVLDDKIATDIAGVSDLFNAAGGIAAVIYDYADRATDSTTGVISFRTKGLNTKVSSLTDEIAKKQDRLAREEADLKARFSKLEALLGQLAAQSSYMTNIIASMNKSSS